MTFSEITRVDSIFSENTWADMRFSEFLKSSWNANAFCHDLAAQARDNILQEMALGTGEVRKMPILWDEDDYKFLYQFPKEVWDEALQWRYNDGIRAAMRTSDGTHVPEGFDWTSHLTFGKPGSPQTKKWIFGNPDGSKDQIYIGITDLLHKLVKPHKGPETEEMGEEAEKQPHWAGEGPGMHQLHHTQQDQYKHGLYDFDLADLIEVDPEDIEGMSDEEVFDRLSPKVKAMGFGSPEAKKAIDRSKKRMQERKKHTFNGFSVLQPDIAQQAIGNWIKLEAIPDNLTDKNTGEFVDPYTGEKKSVTMMPASNFLQRQQKSSGERYSDIPAVSKDMKWKELDVKSGKVTPVDKVEQIPVLTPQKALPRVALSSIEKLKLLEKKGWDIPYDLTHRMEQDPSKADELYSEFRNSLDQKRKADFDTAAKLDDVQGLVDNWSILSDEHKKFIKENQKSLFQVAQSEKLSKFAHEEEKYPGIKDVYDPLASPERIMSPGYSPNKGTPGLPKMNLSKSQASMLEDKYRGVIASELIGTEEVKEGAEGNSMVDQILRGMEKSKSRGGAIKYPKEVIDALRASLANEQSDLVTFLTYMVLSWMTHPQYGIPDDEIPIGQNWQDYDAEKNKKNRRNLVKGLLGNIAQYAISDAVPSRRMRQKYGMPKVGEIGDTLSGKSGLGDIEQKSGGIAQGKAPSEVIEPSVQRAWLYSYPVGDSRAGRGGTARAALKPSKHFSHVKAFMQSKRAFIMNKLKGTNHPDLLEDSEKRITAAIDTGVQLMQEYAEQHPDASEEQLSKMVQDNLQQRLKSQYGHLFGHLEDDSKEWENILARTKNISANVGISGAEARKHDAAALAIYDKFFDKLISAGVGDTPAIVETPEGGIRVADDNSNSTHIDLSNPSLKKPENIISAIRLIVPKQFPSVAEKIIQDKGLRFYKTVIDDQGLAVSDEDAEKEWAKALRTSPTQQQQPTAATAPQQQAPVQVRPQAAPAAAAARQVHELLDSADKFSTPEEMAQIGSAILANKNTLMADKALAARFRTMFPAMRQRRIAMGKIKNTDNQLLGSLNVLYGELGRV